MVVRTRQGNQMQEQEHEVTTLFVGNNLLQLEQVGLAQAESVAQGQREGGFLWRARTHESASVLFATHAAAMAGGANAAGTFAAARPCQYTTRRRAAVG